MMLTELIIRHPQTDSKLWLQEGIYSETDSRKCPHTSLSLKTSRKENQNKEMQVGNRLCWVCGTLAVFPTTQETMVRGSQEQVQSGVQSNSNTSISNVGKP